MPMYYGTFMQKQATRNKFVAIDAPDEGMARDAMFAHFGDKFMTVYDADRFSGQAEQFNMTLLLRITVTDYGHGSVEYTL